MHVVLRRCAWVVALATTVLLALSAVSYAQTGNPNPMNVLVTNTSDNPVPVAGAVKVSNLPATQAVDGTVSVRNLPATQNIAGTVGIDPNANAVSVDLSDAQIETTPPDTSVLLDEVVTLESTCNDPIGCGPTSRFEKWVTFSAAEADRVHLMAYGIGACGGECPKIFISSLSPSDHAFPLGSMVVGDFNHDRQLLEVPGTTVGVTIVYGTHNVSAGNKVHLYAVGR